MGGLFPPRACAGTSATMSVRPLLIAVLMITACGEVAPQPEIVVVHRCKDVNFEDLDGYFARLEGGSNVSTKHRFQATQGGAALEIRHVAGDHAAVRYRSDGAGPDRVLFTEVGGKRALKGTITNECRVQLDAGTAQGGAFTPSADSSHTFVPFEPAARLDYEPCTERLFLDAAARSQKASKKAKPVGDVLPVTRRSETTVGAWSPRSELGAGCKPVIHIWSNGEAEVMTDLEDPGKGDTIHWTYPLANDYVGTRAVSVRRYADCAGQKKLLGVACAQYEVK